MYKKLVKEYLKEQGFPTEQEFNNLFPNLKELDIERFCNIYDPNDNNFINVIIETITNGEFFVLDYWEPDKTIDIELYDTCSKEEFNKYIKLLQDNGWTIYNLEDLHESFEENLNWHKKQKLISKLQNYSYEELKTLMNGD